MGVNVQIIGRLGSDCELKEGTTKDGKPYQFLKFSLATDEYRGGKNETTWLNVVDGSEKSLRMGQYLKKGSLVDVHGIETVSIYTNKTTGAPQISRDVQSNAIYFVSSGQSGSTQNSDATVVKESTDASCGKLVKPAVAASKEGGDDLPF